MRRDDLVAYLDEYLAVEEIEDVSNNGLQVEGDPEVSRVALAVDAGLAACEAARAAGAQMLVVHHGLFWGKPLMVTGIHRRRLGCLFAGGVSLYAAHLPLDSHPEVGNNATLARWLALKETGSFGLYKGQSIGIVGQLARAMPLTDFAGQVESLLGQPLIKIWPFGPDAVQRVAVVSGGAAFLLDQVAAAGADVYLTGEVSHGHFHEAKELGLNVVFAGHYATETAGVKALGKRLAARFGLETVFLELPTEA
jgi:dinuclear metal center YbgI/SA1388 family protein